MTPTGTSGSFAPSARPPFALIVSITLTGIMANTLITPATPDIVADFGVGPSGVGMILSAATAPGILLAPVIGVLADRFGRRETLIPCLLIFGVAGGAASFAPTFSVLILLRFLQGIGAAGLINLAVVIIGDHWDGVERARMIGRNAAALTAAIAVLPPLGGFLTDLGGWQLSFAPYWIGLVTAAAVARMLPKTTRGDSTLAEQLRRTLPYLRSPRVLAPTGMAFVLFVIIFGLFLAVLPVHLSEEFGVSASARGLVLGVPAITSTAVALNIGRLRDRFGARSVVFAGSLLLTAGLLILALAPSLPVLLLGPLVYGLGEGLMIPTLQDIVTGAAPATSRGSVVAMFVGVTRAGQTAGPLMTGAALEQIGSRVLFFAGAALAVLLAGAQQVLGRFVRGAARPESDDAAGGPGGAQ